MRRLNIPSAATNCREGTLLPVDEDGLFCVTVVTSPKVERLIDTPDNCAAATIEAIAREIAVGA